MKARSSISLPLPLLRDDTHKSQTELQSESLCNSTQPQRQSGLLPAKGILGSALQPVSNTLYHYVGKNRTIDQTSTKNWRTRMRQLRFQIFKPEPWSYKDFDFEPASDGNVTVLGSDCQYYRLHERDLKPEGRVGEFPAEESTESGADLWQGEVAE